MTDPIPLDREHPGFSIKRDRNRITIKLVCRDDYAASLLCEEAIESADGADGQMVLTLCFLTAKSLDP